MSSAIRVASAALRSSVSSSFAVKRAGFRYYSSVKPKVREPHPACDLVTDALQTLKETFAAKIPQEIEKIKKLRKYWLVSARGHRCAPLTREGNTAPR